MTIATQLQRETRTLMGWGRTNPVRAELVRPTQLEPLQQLVRQAPPQALIARGLGRSYGDAAQLSGGTVIDLQAFDRLDLDPLARTVTAGAGVSFDRLLRVLVPAGFFLPVTPGTRQVTVGGAIAADVHGKNHHVDGSFGHHVRQILLLDAMGQVRTLRPDDGSSALFWATVAGMGLTGVILEATFALIPITTSWVSVDTRRYRDLETLMAAMAQADRRYRYSVAWVDSLDPAGRGVLTCGDHADLAQLSPAQRRGPLDYDPRAMAAAPALLPVGLLNNLTVRAFNEAWYRKAPRHRDQELQALAAFFHPLDGVRDWNRLYGPAGFLQYQFAVPDAAAALVPRTLQALRQLGAPSFLTVLKRFGPGNPAPLSFPLPGWTLAVDLPAAVPGLFALLDQLDAEVAAAGGRLYLAKDSRQSQAMFQASYPNHQAWLQTVSQWDWQSRFCSDLALRTQAIKPSGAGVCGPC